MRHFLSKYLPHVLQKPHTKNKIFLSLKKQDKMDLDGSIKKKQKKTIKRKVKRDKKRDTRGIVENIDGIGK